MKNVIFMLSILLCSIGASAQVILSPGGEPNLSFTATLGDKISLYGNRLGQPNMYGFGVEANTLYYKSYNSHRWYINKNADGGQIAPMILQPDGFYLRTAMSIKKYVKHIGDFNTLFGFPQKDQFLIQTNGVERFKIVNGKIGVGDVGAFPRATFHIGSGTDATVDDPESGYLMIGDALGRNIVIDNNEIMARNWSNVPSYSRLSFQAEGGEIRVHNLLPVTSRFIINEEGQVGIGQINLGEDKLSVNGRIRCREVRVTNDGWADFVFNDDYQLRSLEEVEKFIQDNRHLPEVPSAEEVLENGTDLGEIDAILLQKVEELTLYLIDLKKENENLKKRIEQIEK